LGAVFGCPPGEINLLITEVYTGNPETGAKLADVPASSLLQILARKPTELGFIATRQTDWRGNPARNAAIVFFDFADPTLSHKVFHLVKALSSGKRKVARGGELSVGAAFTADEVAGTLGWAIPGAQSSCDYKTNLIRVKQACFGVCSAQHS
jgi:hypothetical protein